MIPTNVKHQLNSDLREVRNRLHEAEEDIKFVDYDTIRGKLCYAFLRGRGSQYQLKQKWDSLKNACDRLSSLFVQISHFRSSPSSYLLTPERFKLDGETSDDRPEEFLPDSDIQVAQGNYIKDNALVERHFILEKKFRENGMQYLCTKLDNNSNSKAVDSILPILGYRQPPYQESIPPFRPFYQLVMELPENCTRTSLAHILVTQPPPPVPARRQLCMKVSNALVNVHKRGLVHI